MHGKFSIYRGFRGKSSTFINLANENNDCISCILVHLISFMFIAIYLAFRRIRVAFPRKFISKSVTGIGKTVLQIKYILLTFRQEICHLLFYYLPIYSSPAHRFF